MRLYVIGPVTGMPDDNREAFVGAVRDLWNAGYKADFPHLHVPSDAEWHDAMKISVAHMMQADGVAMLDGWRDSKGARLEYRIARELDMPAYHVGHWLGNAARFLEGGE